MNEKLLKIIENIEKKYNLEISHDAEKRAQLVSRLTWNTELTEK